ncbi:MAG: DUF4407 domain-containing protein [Lewinellaceae bacterium]|nr:DUF4407 domain-containing protein [Lewinellaceae bacterium]
MATSPPPILAYKSWYFRIAVALVLACLCGMTIGVFIFSNEVGTYLKTDQVKSQIPPDSLLQIPENQLNEKVGKELAAVVLAFTPALQEIHSTIESQKAALQSLFDQREKTYQIYRCTCDGSCGNGQLGRGSECARKEQQYLQIDKSYQAQKQQVSIETAQKTAQLATLKIEFRQAVQHHYQQKAKPSLLNRTKALLIIAESDRSVLGIILGICLLLFVIALLLTRIRAKRK